MAKPKKNGTYLNICIDNEVYTKLQAYCEKSGNTKTVAVERALAAYIEEYEKQLKFLEQNKK